MRNISAVLFCCLLGGLVLAQPQESRRRVEVVGLEDDDVGRIARALSTTPQRLNQARSLLEEALTVLLQEETVEELHGLPQQWVRIHPRLAVDRIGEIADRLVRQAGKAQSKAEYDRSWKMLVGCASQMAGLNAPAAHQLLLDWPAPPQRLGAEVLKKHSEMWRWLTSQEFADGFRRDPQKAINALRNDTLLSPSIFHRLDGLKESPEKAPLVVQDVIEQISASRSDQRSAQVLVNVAHRVGRSSPELLPSLFEALRRISPPSAARFVMRAGSQEMTMSYAEYHIWYVIRHSTGRRPQLMLEILREVPWLSDLVDQAGGLDELLNATQVGSVDAQGKFSRSQVRSQAKESDRAQDLIREMPFRPEWVHRQVEQISEQEDAFKQLGALLNKSRHKSLELASWCLQAMRSSLESEDLEPQQRERRLATLIGWEASLNDVVDFDLIQMALSLAEEKRSREEENSSRVQLGGPPPVEISAVAAWARLDFQAALNHSRTFQSRARLEFLRSMMQSLASR